MFLLTVGSTVAVAVVAAVAALAAIAILSTKDKIVTTQPGLTVNNIHVSNYRFPVIPGRFPADSRADSVSSVLGISVAHYQFPAIPGKFPADSRTDSLNNVFGIYVYPCQ